MLARINFSEEGSWRAFRLLNAAHLLAYAGLGEVYNEDNFINPLVDKYCLLTEKEILRVKEISLNGEFAFREIIAWLLQIVKHEMMTRGLSRKQEQLISSQLLCFRGSLSRFYHFKDLPMPFPYVHCINLHLFIFFPLYSYTLASSYSRFNSAGESLHFLTVFGDSLIQSFFLFLYTLIILCLRTLGQNLAEPLGHNLEDLPVYYFVDATILGTMNVMHSSPLKRTFEEDESVLFSLREPLGKPFPFSRKQTKENRKTPNNTNSNNRSKSKEDSCLIMYGKDALALVTPKKQERTGISHGQIDILCSDYNAEEENALLRVTSKKEERKHSAAFVPIYNLSRKMTQPSKIYVINRRLSQVLKDDNAPDLDEISLVKSITNEYSQSAII